MKYRMFFFIAMSSIFIIINILIAFGIIDHFPNVILIVGTGTILIMNIINPIIEKVLIKNSERKKDLEKYDNKGTSFLVGFIFSILLSASFYYYSENQSYDWLDSYIQNGLIWGINSAILMINLAIIEINNNRKKTKEEYLEKKKEKEYIIGLQKEKLEREKNDREK